MLSIRKSCCIALLAATPLGCAAASEPDVASETGTEEATNSIEMVDEQITGCNVLAVFEGSSESSDIDFIAVDVSDLEQDNLELSLEAIDEMGRRVVIDTHAVLVSASLTTTSSLDSLHTLDTATQSASQSSAASTSDSDTLSTYDSSLVQSQDQSSASNDDSTSSQSSLSISEAFSRGDGRVGAQGRSSRDQSQSSASQSSSQTASSSSDSAQTVSTVDQASNSQSSQSSQSSSSSSSSSELDQVSSDDTLDQSSQSSDITESSLLEETSTSSTMAFQNLSQYRLRSFVLTANREVTSSQSSIRVFMGGLEDLIADESFDEAIASCQ